jgi:hypothetical protein
MVPARVALKAALRPAGDAGGLSATQRLAIYMVISKPNRMSVAAGRSHFIVISLGMLLLLSFRLAATDAIHRRRRTRAAKPRDFLLWGTARRGTWRTT